MARHVARYCGRVETCAPGQNEGAVCAVKFLEGAKTREGRRGIAAMMNMFDSCMTMDCLSMSVCFAAKSARKAKELIDESPPPRHAPHVP